MVTDRHILTGKRGSDGWLFTCNVCPRQLVLKDDGELVVLVRGDFYASHRGLNQTVVTMTAEVEV